MTISIIIINFLFISFFIFYYYIFFFLVFSFPSVLPFVGTLVLVHHRQKKLIKEPNLRSHS